MLKIVTRKTLLLIAILVASMSSSLYADTHDQKNNATYLYLQFAKSATITSVDASKNTFLLTLKNVSPYVSYFSNRPKRVTGVLPVKTFLMAWQQPGKGSFGTMPPNASIAGVTIRNILSIKEITLVMELKNPRYNEKKETLVFDATIVDPLQQKIPTKKIELHNVTVFFDDVSWCPGCCCG